MATATFAEAFDNLQRGVLRFVGLIDNSYTKTRANTALITSLALAKRTT
jgi:hypothetical protein